MAIVITTGRRYQSAGRFRIDWTATDNGEVIDRNRASFDDEPDQATEDAAFANILDWVTRERGQRLNRINQKLVSRFGGEWIELRPILLQWINSHPAATAGEAKTALDTAFPNMVYDAQRLLTKLLNAFNPPFASWAEFRDYIVANYTTIVPEVL